MISLPFVTSRGNTHNREPNRKDDADTKGDAGEPIETRCPFGGSIACIERIVLLVQVVLRGEVELPVDGHLAEREREHGARDGDGEGDPRPYQQGRMAHP